MSFIASRDAMTTFFDTAGLEDTKLCKWRELSSLELTLPSDTPNEIVVPSARQSLPRPSVIFIIEEGFAVAVWGCHASGVLELAASAIFCLLEVMVQSGYRAKGLAI